MVRENENLRKAVGTTDKKADQPRAGAAPKPSADEPTLVRGDVKPPVQK